MTEISNNYVKYIRAEQVFGRLNFEVEFKPTINIIHAGNGAGKTTLLHILANALNGDFLRFAHLQFDRVNIALADGQHLEIRRMPSERGYRLVVIRNDTTVLDALVSNLQRPRSYRRRTLSGQLSSFEDDEFANDIPFDEVPVLSTSYFPAFRTMIEAWAVSAATDEERYHDQRIARQLLEQINQSMAQGSTREEAINQILLTNKARRVFGEFVPTINYPSPNEIARNLSEEIQRAVVDVGNISSQLLSDAFIEIFNSLSISKSPQSQLEDADEILSEIQEVLSEDRQNRIFQGESPIPITQAEGFDRLSDAVRSFRLNSEARKFAPLILDVYRRSLKERANAQEAAFSQIKSYLDSVNDFLTQKQLVIATFQNVGTPSVGIMFEGSSIPSGLHALSSGERQIITLVYAATRMSSQQVVLVDEPEISLHIDWQRILIEKMAEQLGDRQIIVCTHAPSIGANHLSAMIELKPQYSNKLQDYDE